MMISLGVDASEFLGEERCGAHHQHNRKGQFDCFFSYSFIS